MKIKHHILVFMFASMLLNAGTIKTWVTGEVLTAADLNANFAHIHRNMVGQHGPRAFDIDFSDDAGMPLSVIAGGVSLPRRWVTVSKDDGVNCGSAPPATCVFTGAGVSGVGTFKATYPDGGGGPQYYIVWSDGRISSGSVTVDSPSVGSVYNVNIDIGVDAGGYTTDYIYFGNYPLFSNTHLAAGFTSIRY